MSACVKAPAILVGPLVSVRLPLQKRGPLTRCNAVSIATESNGAQLLSQRGDPTWEIALLFPEQGDWSEADYFGLKTKRLVELDDGFLEVLPMPTLLHQTI